ncbi:MAG: site-specific integrase [Clostridiales bacterium]|nr:site-specific integrase [Clostridiales bacterium]
MAKKKSFRLPPGYGSVTKLSGNRRRPYMVKVNTKRDDRGYPKFDILGYYEKRADALQALADYNKNPYDLKASKATFQDVYEMWFKRKYETSKKKYSQSSINCTVGAFKKCVALHDKIFTDIRTIHLQAVLDDFTLSHAYMEHIKNLFNQMYKYALEYDIIQKDYSQFVKINKEDDDEHGVPFSKEDLKKLWQHKDKPFVDTVLIYIYSGWRISELLNMPLENIDMEQKTFQGGVKTRASKNRIVPIHSKVYDMVKARHQEGQKTLFYHEGKKVTVNKYYEFFRSALQSAGITEPHTPHDCRHTFATLLNNANANPVAVKRLLGHSTNDITERIYTHKDIDELRTEIEKI